MALPEKPIDTAFTVLVHTDGTFSVLLETPAEPLELQRNPSDYDVFHTSQQIVAEIEQQLLTNRIVSTLAQILTPQPEPTVADSIKEKLKERKAEAETSDKE